MITKTIISRQPSGGISITYYDNQDDFDAVIQRQVTNVGNVVIEVVDGVVEKPDSKDDRDCWEIINGKVVVDQNKLAAKEAKKAEKQAILAKLKITQEELDNLLKR